MLKIAEGAQVQVVEFVFNVFTHSICICLCTYTVLVLNQINNCLSRSMSLMIWIGTMTSLCLG